MTKPSCFSILGAAALAFSLSACAKSTVGPPSDIENACSIKQERNGWYQAARTAAKKWEAPTPVLLAIIWRESKFQPEAQTPRRYALGVVPWGRQSSAYGFSQAIDGTWNWYQDDQDASGADRENFADAVDFVGWYMHKSRKKLGVAMHDAQTQYLAYHEGHGGYRRGKWREKAFLVEASRQVARMASLYDSQLRSCDHDYARERGLAKAPIPKRRPVALSVAVKVAIPKRKALIAPLPRPMPTAMPANLRRDPGAVGGGT